jgi:hypothetical protein
MRSQYFAFLSPCQALFRILFAFATSGQGGIPLSRSAQDEENARFFLTRAGAFVPSAHLGKFGNEKRLVQTTVWVTRRRTVPRKR